ncbi:VIT domain-containing protein [Fontisphaera persica]|uniref:VIT domain-containing protein n=1 Tax=Fontisphaera persica TaxID=2974023 RepID=UPI0024C0CB10|nr:VIT domain-containing protein [Fontisphaera persica]WCJ58568.1 VIT domain-containing protein [Fontisphaera persica]
MKRAALLALVLGLTLPAVMPGRAAGLIIVHEPDFWTRPIIWPPPYPPYPPPPRPPRPLPPPVWAPLEITATRADITIKDQVAVTTVEQEFYNPNARQLEGTFLFPVPRGAQLRKFTMDINGKPMEAELLAADKARGIYEDIVRRLRDPALLEYAGRDLYKVRIFPIEPHGKKRITVTYQQLLKADAGLVAYTLPLSTEKFSAAPVKNLSFKLTLETTRPLKTLYSPSHKVEIKRDGARRAVIGHEATQVKPDTDFQLYYSVEEGEFGVSLLTHRRAGEEGFFLALLSPPPESGKEKPAPKDILFVVDTSGSMSGAKMEQARKALRYCVENLNEEDRFDVIRFATETEALFQELKPANKEHRQKAQEFINGLRAAGGTAIHDALLQALRKKPAGDQRPFLVIFLTDGQPTVGETDAEAILKSALKAREGVTRVFCFGIGTDVNTHLLDLLAENTRAASQYVLPEEDLEVKLSQFYAKISEPVLTNPTLTFDGPVKVRQVHPSPLPDVFRGDQVVVAGRFEGQGAVTIILEGQMKGQPRRFTFPVKFAESEDHDFIPRLWATRRVGFLLDEIRLRGENKELKDEVTELARRYGIVTPYTAYLIVEDEQRRNVAATQQTMRWLAEDRAAQRELSLAYEEGRRQRAGDLAVAGAQASASLKSAERAHDAMLYSGRAVLRAAPMAVPGAAGGGMVRGQPASPEQAALAAQQFAAVSRFVGGRTFYQNGAQWVDAEAQKLKDQTPIKIVFASPEYFELLRKYPQTAAWFSLGANLQIVLDGKLYEIVEASPTATP